MRFPDKDTSQAILSTIQAIAVIAGGCWVAFRYLTHEREAERLARAQHSFSNEQMIRLAATQRASEEAKLRQLQLENEHATLAAQIQKEEQDLSLATQKLTVERARLELRTAETQRDLRLKELSATVRVHEADAAKREQEVAYGGEIRFEPSHRLTCTKRRDLGGNLSEYELTYTFKITSRSTIPFDVSFYVIDLYIGYPRTHPSESTARRLNIPNLRNFTMKPRADDAFEWRHVNATGGILQAVGLPYGSVERPAWSYAPPVDITLNALGLGHLKNGTWSSRTETYFIAAPSDAYVTAFVAYCFNSCREATDGFTGSSIVALRDAKQPTEPANLDNSERGDTPGAS